MLNISTKKSIVILTCTLAFSLCILDIIELHTYTKARPSSGLRSQHHYPSFTSSINQEEITPFETEDPRKQLLGSKSDYEIKEKIGVGGWSKVFRGVNIQTGEDVALKYYAVPLPDKKFQKEIRILKDLNDAPNMIRLREIFTEEINGKEQYVPVFDYFEKDSYKEIFPRLTKFQIKYFIYQLFRTLEYAHNKGVIHRDIKPSNVLMNTKTLQLGIIDWAVSDYYVPGKNLRTTIGTFPYQPPEILLGYKKYNPTYDVWSAGCLLAEMAFQKRGFFNSGRIGERGPHMSQNDIDLQKFKELLDGIAEVLGTSGLKEYFNKYEKSMDFKAFEYVGNYEKIPLKDFINEGNAHLVDEELIDLLEHIFVYDHDERFTATEVLQHPYFNDIRSIIYNG